MALRTGAVLLVLGVLCAVIVPIYVVEPGPIAYAHVESQPQEVESCLSPTDPARPSLLARSAKVGWDCGGSYGCVTLERELLGWRVVDLSLTLGHIDFLDPDVTEVPERGCT